MIGVNKTNRAKTILTFTIVLKVLIEKSVSTQIVTKRHLSEGDTSMSLIPLLNINSTQLYAGVALLIS